MIIYRSLARDADAFALLSPLVGTTAETHWRSPSHDDVVGWLIAAGELEAAVSDATGDGSAPPTTIERALRRSSHLAGAALLASWEGRRQDAAGRLSDASAIINSLPAESWRRTLRASVPEGYSQYGVYPETYVDAARRFMDRRRPAHVVAIGIRSIGTSLSAVVSAAAVTRGCPVTTLTVRPHGHPYDRQFSFSRELSSQLRSTAQAHFAIVDEGPGRSGSSFAAVANALLEIGVSEERIALFPSWDTDGAQLLNEKARDLWRRLERYPASFDRVWIDSGRLGAAVGGRRLVDVSAGRWRRFAAGAASSPTVPQFERRKFLTRGAETAPAHGAPRATLLKFAGLGEHGVHKLHRAETLAEAGFTLRVDALRHGFLLQPWLPNQAVALRRPGGNDLEVMAQYLAFLARHCKVNNGVPGDETFAMVEANVTEGIEQPAAARLMTFVAAHREMFGGQAVALDGRMFPVEWLRTGERLIKTDALDHHNDHLFPGCQDIAWDVAGTCIEFELDVHAARHLIGRVSTLAHDRTLAFRVPIFAIAYLAFRLGFATTVATSMASTSDGAHYAAITETYRRRLRAATAEA
jgi:hypothetical protein